MSGTHANAEESSSNGNDESRRNVMAHDEQRGEQIEPKPPTNSKQTAAQRTCKAPAALTMG